MTDPGQDRGRPGPGGTGLAGTAGDVDGVGDENVSRRYREAARERAPATLDERIRARARRVPPRRGWQRPLALAATLALAVSLVLQVTAPPEESGPALAPDDRPADPAQADAPATRSPAAGAAKSAAKSVSGRQSVPGNQDLSDPALQSGRSVAEEALSELGRASRRAAESFGGEAPEAGSVRCTEHVADARAWAACIAALEAAGEAAAAERERRAWEARHGEEDAVAH
ncbi:MAG: hypothetical protein GVY21_02540 [Gammaproteobacteria bacterium]|jgi:hypothetical protein|nr:hypothetical protein [Gammaproteobacteria bacterium]